MKQVYRNPDGSYGYRVEVNGFKINQPFKPCVSGYVGMTQEEATLYSDLIEKKINEGLSATLEIPIMDGLKNKTLSAEKIIADEKLAIANAPHICPMCGK